MEPLISEGLYQVVVQKCKRQTEDVKHKVNMGVHGYTVKGFANTVGTVTF